MLSYGWQSNADTWAQISQDLLSSGAWRHVGFTELDAAAVPRDQPGIYMLCATAVGHSFSTRTGSGDLFSNLMTPIYIGKTKNLRQRFLRHCRNPSPKVRAAGLCFGQSLAFWFHRVVPERLSDDEAVLIQCFGPPANERSETIPAFVGKAIPIGLAADRPNSTATIGPA